MLLGGSAIALLAGVLLDRLVGDPPWLWRHVPHPVALFGAAIDRLDRGWNDAALPERRRRHAGIVAICLLTAAAALIGLGLQWGLSLLGPPGLALEACVIAIFLAQGSLRQHVAAVATELSRSLADGRHAVSMIVGRDPDQLDDAGVCRAAIESLAENTSDGVIAPFIYAALFGLPGLFAYKMINTADSMIGHMSARHRAFGMGAARLDDLVNWPAARLTALLFALVAVDRRAWRIARRDAPMHRSPNAGWPEAAMAAALGLSLGGPRRYGALSVDAPCLNGEGRREARIGDIGRALTLYGRTCSALLAIAVLLVFASA